MGNEFGFEDDERKPTICHLCGAMLEYNGLGEYVCPDCGHAEYDAYGIVRAYLEKNPGANVLQVERATGIQRQKISRMISDGRFTATDGLMKTEMSDEQAPVKKGVYANNNHVEASRMWSKDLRP